MRHDIPVTAVLSRLRCSPAQCDHLLISIHHHITSCHLLHATVSSLTGFLCPHMFLPASLCSLLWCKLRVKLGSAAVLHLAASFCHLHFTSLSASGVGEEGCHLPVGGESLFTTAHHASALTLSTSQRGQCK